MFLSAHLGYTTEGEITSCKKEQTQNIPKQTIHMPFRKQLPPLLGFQNPPLLSTRLCDMKLQVLKDRRKALSVM